MGTQDSIDAIVAQRITDTEFPYVHANERHPDTAPDVFEEGLTFLGKIEMVELQSYLDLQWQNILLRTIINSVKFTNLIAESNLGE